MLIKDRVTLTSRERTAEGYLRVTARLARTGLQDYLRGEIGLDGDPAAILKVLRPESEVFDSASMTSFALKPVTDDHPSDPVNIGNFKDLAVGFSGENIARDGEFLKGTLVITDQRAIAQIESGKSEISLGYFVELELTPGKTSDGLAYDAVQRKIRGNHIALVDAGRCGGQCRIDDRKSCDGACGCASCRQKKESEMTDKPNTKTVVVDGVPVEANDAAAAVIERLQKQNVEAKDALIAMRDKRLDEQDRHTKELATRDEQIATLKAATSPAAIAKLCDARLSLIVKAADYLGDDYETDGKTNAQIAKDAVSSVLGADAVANRSDEQALAMFDTLSAQSQNGVSLADAVLPQGRKHAADNGRAEYAKNLSDAWKPASAAKH